MRQVGRLGVWYPVDRLEAAGIRRLLRTVEKISATRRSGTRKLLQINPSPSPASCWRTRPNSSSAAPSQISTLAIPSPPGAACAPCQASMMIASSSASVSATRPWSSGCVAMSTTSLCRPCAAISTGLYEDPSNAAEWPVVIAALGPLMLKLAAERTAGAVPYNVTPEHTRGARAAWGLQAASG